jgi:4,5-dihydroxyphthalate decarboxylase
VKVTPIPPSTNIGAMLLERELDATLLYLTNPNLVDRSRIDLSRHPDIRPLFADREAEGRRYYAKTGIYPINHTVVVQRAVLERHPWIALNLYAAFAAARARVIREASENLGPFFAVGLLGDDARQALGRDPMPYGMRAARPVLETIAQYVHEQGLTDRCVGLEELFAPSTMDL